MINIAIVEDDSEYVDIIQDYLTQYEDEHDYKFNITVFYSGEEIVDNYKEFFDIILLDIEMECVNGIAAAEEIRKVDKEVIIIFVTNMPQYAIDGYKVNAFDFILKPLFYFPLSQRIEKAIECLQKRKKRFYPVVFKGGVQKLDINRIKYIEVQNHESIFYTLDGEVRVKDSLKNIESDLAGGIFFRCHKWFIVNLDFIEKIKDYNIYLGNDIIQVSRSRKKELLDALNNYINEYNR